MHALRLAAGLLAASFVGCLFFVPTYELHAQQGASSAEVLDNIAPHPAPSQPLPYSHKTHVALGLTCDTCHTNPEPKAQMSFPAASTCMTCHLAVAAGQPSIMRLKAYADSGEAIPWTRVYTLLPGVIWSHAPHRAAGVRCDTCHGDVGALEQMSMTTAVTAMASCIGCHESRDAPTGCATCHAWPQE